MSNDHLNSAAPLPRPTQIVGVGASAGGLQALEQLFDALPADTGMTFVVIQHLSPNFDSIMDQLLARHSCMCVEMIEDAVEPLPNHVYLLPPGKEAIFSNGRLYVTERTEGRNLSFPIDEFFRTLAQDVGERAVGVILSGTGSDGSRGILDISTVGGTVIVQSVESAAFDGMPNSALATGSVDYALAPDEIGRALVRIATGELPTPTTKKQHEGMKPVDHMEPSMRQVFNLLHGEFGLDFSQYKSAMIARRVERRLKLSPVDELTAYVDLLRRDTDELNQLYFDMLIGVTEFFRDANVFERLQLDALPRLIDGLNADEEFRCWVAGTATGQEAYSLAILLFEEFEKRGLEPRVRIFASDVHDASLTIAGRGIYPAEQLSSLTQERRDRFFIERHDGFHVTPELRSLVVFTPHNVIRDAPFTRLHLISCRNVLIYFTPTTQQRVLSLFHFGLRTDGVLCLGNSESVGDLRSEFQPVDESLKIYLKHRDISTTAMRAVVRTPWLPVRTGDQTRERQSAQGLLRVYDRLLSELMSPALLVNERREILHVLGGAGRYLSFDDGRPQNDLLSVIQSELRAPLSLAMIHVRRDGEPLCVRDISCRIAGEQKNVNLRVDNFDGDPDTPALLIRFEEEEATKAENVQTLTPDDISSVEHLERELQSAQDNLQATISEHQSTNEELQSTNEQLTASNEELQSTNEELHSVNEELYTVNAEHQRKIEELTELNDDIDNLLTTTNVHTLFLDSRLRLRRFTPRIAEIFNLIPQDIGRAISSFTHRLQDRRIAESIQEVIKTETPIHREVKDEKGQWYLLRIFPYLSRGTVEGAVLTLVDVTTLQAATEALQKSEERFDLAVRGSNVGIWDWKDVTEEAIWCSSRMYSLLGRNTEYEMTISLWQELIHPEDQDRFVAALNGHLKNDAPFDIEYRMECELENGYRWYHMRGAAERIDGGRVVRMAGSFEDVTDRRKAEREVKLGVTRRDQFLAMLSHELRNPLGAVTNAIAVLAGANGDTTVFDRAVGVMRRQMQQMSRLLDDLLDVSRITHGKIELRRKHIDLTQIVEHAASVVRTVIEEADLNFSLEVSAEPLYVEGDPARLEQVTVNLLTNAAKYTSAGGNVSLNVHAEDNEVIIEVRDSGAGIAADKIDEIFSLFYQSDETLDRSNGGMGVGLTLVKAVVSLHGGTVTAASDGPGTGSTFTVRLPMSISAAETVESRPPVSQSKIKSIVLIEDIDDARDMLAALLSLQGLDVHEAKTGPEGLRKIIELRPDAAIIDIGLPEMDGHEVARRVRKHADVSSIPLVALTGYGRDSDRQKVRESGYDLHLIKPLNPEKLDGIIAGLQEVDRTAEHVS